jgi:hypothetical protein
VSADIASYFDDPVEAEKLFLEARSWIGTPFRQYFPQHMEAGLEKLKAMGMDTSQLDIKGKGGGIDCIGLDEQIFSRIGATPKWMFPRESADYQSHRTGDKILDWLRGKVDDPQSKRLGELFVELEIPEVVKDRHAETPRDFFKPGDILVMRHGGLFHLPLIYDHELHFVSALPRLGVIEGTVQDSTYSIHLVTAFRLKPRQ